MKFPIKIYTDKIESFSAIGISFFIWIFIHPKMKNHYLLNSLINHEVIHYKQQVELLFIFNWILYGLFYLYNLIFLYQNHSKAYKMNPFEREAYDNETDYTYLEERKPYAWLKYVSFKKVK